MSETIKKFWRGFKIAFETAASMVVSWVLWGNLKPYVKDFFIKVYDFAYPKLYEKPSLFGYYAYLEERDKKLSKPIEYATHVIPLLLISSFWLTVMFLYRRGRAPAPLPVAPLPDLAAKIRETKPEGRHQRKSTSPRRHVARAPTKEIAPLDNTLMAVIPPPTFTAPKPAPETFAAAAPVTFSSEVKDLTTRTIPEPKTPQQSWVQQLWHDFHRGANITQAKP